MGPVKPVGIPTSFSPLVRDVMVKFQGRIQEYLFDLKRSKTRHSRTFDCLPFLMSKSGFCATFYIAVCSSLTFSDCSRNECMVEVIVKSRKAWQRLAGSPRGHNTVFTFVSVCLSVCLWALSPIGLNGRNDVLFAKKCIRLVYKKLTVVLTCWY